MKLRDKWREQGLCPSCGRPREGDYLYCEGCRKHSAKLHRERKSVRKPKASNLDEICIEAKKAGMSYGKYLARCRYER